MSNAGDVNDDGTSDIIVGAPYANSFAGEVYVVFGCKTTSNINVGNFASSPKILNFMFYCN